MKAKIMTNLCFAASLAVLAGACGETKEMDLSYCKEVSRIAQGSPADFAVVAEETESTSEGVYVTLTATFTNAAGEQETVRDKCWFDSNYNNKLARFSVERDGTFEKIPDEELEALRKAAGENKG